MNRMPHSCSSAGHCRRCGLLTTIALLVMQAPLAAERCQESGARYIVGPDAGIQTEIRAYDSAGMQFLFDFHPFGTFSGGVRVAQGDFNGDGVADIVAGAPPGGMPRVRVFDGTDQPQILADFFAFATTFSGGVSVASGDVNGDGFDDIIVGAANGVAHVRGFAGPQIQTDPGGEPTSELFSFFAFPISFTGGVEVASGDFDGDQIDDIIAGAGPGGTPSVAVFDGEDQSSLGEFLAYAASYTGGISVAAGDVNDDGFDDVITGALTGPGHLRVFDATDTSSFIHDFFAFDISFSGGIRVASNDANADGHDDMIAGTNSSGGSVRVFSGVDASQIDTLTPFGAGHSDGLRVSGSGVASNLFCDRFENSP